MAISREELAREQADRKADPNAMQVPDDAASNPEAILYLPNPN